MTYWLSRKGGAAEGPFTQGQILRMWEAGEITAEDQMCPTDVPECWLPAAMVIEELEVRATAMMQERNAELMKERTAMMEERMALYAGPRRKEITGWKAVGMASLIAPLIFAVFWFGMQKIHDWSMRQGGARYEPQHEYEREQGRMNLEALKEAASKYGGSVTGGGSEPVYIGVPGPISAFGARQLARETWERVGGLVRVRDGSGKVVASCDAFGVRDGK